MIREQAEALMPFIQAFVDGKTIQFHNKLEGWVDMSKNLICFDQVSADELRIKTEPAYRPFENAEECWQEMQKHLPFGWIQDKDNGVYKSYILSVDDGGIMTTDYADDIIRRTYDAVLFDSTFADGTPFGIKDE